MAKAKDQPEQAIPSHQEVASYMAAMRAQQRLQAFFLSSPGCTQVCLTASAACQEARHIVEDTIFQATFGRLVLSIIEDTDVLDPMWPELLLMVQAKRSPKSNELELFRCVLVHASYWFADHRGAQAGWSYAETEQLTDTLRKVLLSKLGNENAEPLRSQFQMYARQLHTRTYAPFAACRSICQQQPLVCLYRYAVADLVATGRHSGAWRTAVANDTNSQDGRFRETLAVSRMVGSELIEFPEDAWPDPLKQKVWEGVQRTSLCYAQQALAKDISKTPGTARKIMEKLLREV
jgi:hypothetical protein